MKSLMKQQVNLFRAKIRENFHEIFVEERLSIKINSKNIFRIFSPKLVLVKNISLKVGISNFRFILFFKDSIALQLVAFLLYIKLFSSLLRST